MSDHHLQEMFGISGSREREPSYRRSELETLLPDYAARLSRKGVTVKNLFEEYSAQYPNGYHHSAFGALLRRYMFKDRAVGHVEHYAGEQMYIDYAGDKLEVVDDMTGEVKRVEVFVAIQPCSHYTYCEASWSQCKEDLISSCENAMRFFGGVPLAIVPDNLKSAVTKSDRNEPIINPEFAAFAEHYECAIYPARVRHPKDKALVENAVKLLYRSVYADIEGLVFHDLPSLNTAILKSLDAFNNRKLTGRDGTRKKLFEQIESGYLRELPAMRYQMKERRSVTVMKNSYFTLFKHHYSVPVKYVGRRVEIIYDSESIEVYYGLNLITIHERDDSPYGYTRKESHNLPGRHGSYDKDIEDLYQRAAEIDNIVLNYLKEVAHDKKYPPNIFRSCRGILSLERKYGQDRLVAACACATQKREYSYHTVRDILERGEDADFLSTEDNVPYGHTNQPLIVSHKNIRGREYYSKTDKSVKKLHNGNK